MVLPDFSIPQIASFFVKDIADLPAPAGEVHEDISRAIHLPEVRPAVECSFLQVLAQGVALLYSCRTSGGQYKKT